MSKTFAMALAGALAMGVLAAPAAEAGGKHKHHRFFFKPYHFHYYEPVCGKWFWSHRRQKFVCAWWH
jgi:hypothetical protein